MDYKHIEYRLDVEKYKARFNVDHIATKEVSLEGIRLPIDDVKIAFHKFDRLDQYIISNTNPDGIIEMNVVRDSLEKVIEKEAKQIIKEVEDYLEDTIVEKKSKKAKDREDAEDQISMESDEEPVKEEDMKSDIDGIR